MTPWNKGLNKFTSPSLLKTSITLAGKKRSNFWQWQQSHKLKYSKLRPSSTLAEFYGTMLGDGCLEKFPRTDKLTISFNRKEQAHLQHVAKMMTRLFRKAPSVRVRKNSLCDDLYLYQKYLASRLDFPYGTKLLHRLAVPQWMRQNQLYLKHCLKGLFETDGNWSIDKKHKTNVIKFTNHSDSLLDDLHEILINIGYHPQRRQYDVRLARNKEVYRFADWIKFRKYSGIV